MTTKNIQDVVVERVEKAIIRLATTGLFEGKGDEILQPYADWLTETLTQLVKEVEVGERHKIKLRIDYDRRKGIPAEETVTDIYDSIELKETTPPPPTSDVIEK